MAEDMQWHEFHQAAVKKYKVLDILFLQQEVTFTRLDTSGNGKNGSGLLHAVETLLSSIFIPALKNLDKGWGALGTPSGEQVRQDFLNTLDSFVSVLVGE